MDVRSANDAASVFSGSLRTFKSNMIIIVRNPFGDTENYLSASGRECEARRADGHLVVVYADGSGLGSPRLPADLEKYESLPNQPNHVLRKKAVTSGYVVPEDMSGTAYGEDGKSQEFSTGDLVAVGERGEVWVVKAEKLDPTSPKCGFVETS